MFRTLVVALLLATFAAAPGSAHHCAGPATSPSTPINTAAGQFHLSEDGRVYQEENQIPGLQRDDGSRDDTCHGMIPPDHLII